MKKLDRTDIRKLALKKAAELRDMGFIGVRILDCAPAPIAVVGFAKSNARGWDVFEWYKDDKEFM